MTHPALAQVSIQKVLQVAVRAQRHEQGCSLAFQHQQLLGAAKACTQLFWQPALEHTADVELPRAARVLHLQCQGLTCPPCHLHKDGG